MRRTGNSGWRRWTTAATTPPSGSSRSATPSATSSIGAPWSAAGRTASTCRCRPTGGRTAGGSSRPRPIPSGPRRGSSARMAYPPRVTGVDLDPAAEAREEPAPDALAAAAAIADATGHPAHDVAVVLGSGWVPAADVLGSPDADFAVTDLPGFAPPAVAGHSGRVRSVTVACRRVLVFLG